MGLNCMCQRQLSCGSAAGVLLQGHHVESDLDLKGYRAASCPDLRHITYLHALLFDTVLHALCLDLTPRCMPGKLMFT